MNGSLPDPTAAIFYSNSATPLSAAMKPKLGICCCMPVIARACSLQYTKRFVLQACRWNCSHVSWISRGGKKKGDSACQLKLLRTLESKQLKLSVTVANESLREFEAKSLPLDFMT